MYNPARYASGGGGGGHVRGFKHPHLASEKRLLRKEKEATTYLHGFAQLHSSVFVMYAFMMSRSQSTVSIVRKKTRVVVLCLYILYADITEATHDLSKATLMKVCAYF